MALNKDQAAGLAKELMLALAQSGSLKLRGASAASVSGSSTNLGAQDAAYLSSLYRNLAEGFQK